jgi:hypothetical protein
MFSKFSSELHLSGHFTALGNADGTEHVVKKIATTD